MNASAYDFTRPAGKAVIFGDSRPQDPFERLIGLENTDRIRPQIFQTIASEKANAIFHAGDIAANGALRAGFWKWTGWETFRREVCATVGCGANFFPAIGNHDYGNVWGHLPGVSARALRLYFEQFPHLGGRTYYSVSMGPVLFLVMDSNFEYFGERTLQEEVAWARAVLERGQADLNVTHILPIYHHPAYTNVSRHVKERREVQEHFVELFKRYAKVKAAFSGHVHSYERIPREGIQHIVTGGGGSPRFKLKVGKGRRHLDLYAESDTTLRDFHYMRLTTEAAGLRVEMVRLHQGAWSVGDSFLLKAKTDHVFQGSGAAK